MSIIRGFLALLGRIMLVAVFLSAAAGNMVPHYEETIALMRAQNIPYPEYFLPGAIVFLAIGGLSVLVGFKARFGAFLLLIFLAAATYYFHNFWDKTNPQEIKMVMVDFMKNLSIAGAMVFIIAVGAGPGSIDARATDTTG
jgi:putative oxidoreductase